MKKRLNLFCLLVFLTLLVSSVPFMQLLGSATVGGFRAGWDAAMAESGDTVLTGDSHAKVERSQDYAGGTSVWIRPDFKSFHAMRVHNRATGTDVAIYPMGEVTAVVDHEFSLWADALALVGSAAVVGLAVGILVCFVRVIRRINKGDVFSWNNVRLLRRMGWCEIAAAMLYTLINTVRQVCVADVFQPEGFVINWFGAFSGQDIILGLVALIVAEAFAIGIKMKEEQELTV